MSSLLVALGRIIMPYRLINLTFGMLLARFAKLSGHDYSKGVSLADIRTAVDSAHDGDVVEVPPGAASWTATLYKPYTYPRPLVNSPSPSNSHQEAGGSKSVP